MKIYEIIDDETMVSVGCILYYAKEKSFIIELNPNLDEWTAPLIFSEAVKRGRVTMGRELSLKWVRERIIPSGRQNIGSILKNAGLSDYDEMELLSESGARSSQDHMYIKKMENAPEYVKRRMEHNLRECVICKDNSMLCFFFDDTVRKVSLDELSDISDVDKLASNTALFQSGHVAAGGYCVTFNDSIDISADILYDKGILIPLVLDDFLAFVRLNTVDTSESCELLGCSRQNLSYLVSKEILSPVKRDVNGNLFTKGDLLGSRW